MRKDLLTRFGIELAENLVPIHHHTDRFDNSRQCLRWLCLYLARQLEVKNVTLIFDCITDGNESAQKFLEDLSPLTGLKGLYILPVQNFDQHG